MSKCLGMVLSSNCSGKTLDYFRDKYDLLLSVVYNKKFTEQQLMNDELFIDPTKFSDDSYTGIGNYKLYTMDMSDYKEKLKDDSYGYHIVIDEYYKRRDGFKKDCLKWMDIIKEMRVDYNISKVGIFYYYDADTTLEELELPIYERSYCKISDLTMEKLMKIKQNEIMFFI